MPTSTPTARNWFDQGGRDYARFRPEYPQELADFLASLAPDRRLAVDAGCGNGQLTRLLAPCFERVLGVDPSADQIAYAIRDDRIDYRCAPAERIPLPDASANLVTAAPTGRRNASWSTAAMRPSPSPSRNWRPRRWKSAANGALPNSWDI